MSDPMNDALGVLTSVDKARDMVNYALEARDMVNYALDALDDLGTAVVEALENSEATAPQRFCISSKDDECHCHRYRHGQDMYHVCECGRLW